MKNLHGMVCWELTLAQSCKEGNQGKKVTKAGEVRRSSQKGHRTVKKKVSLISDKKNEMEERARSDEGGGRLNMPKEPCHQRAGILKHFRSSRACLRKEERRGVENKG